MTATARLTDEEIDRLEGRELDEAVARALGWTSLGAYWYAPGEHGQQFKGHCFHSVKVSNDLGSAMGLLLTATTFAIESADLPEATVWVTIWMRCDGGMYSAIACGNRDDLATVICRAFLKLSGRSR